MSKIRCCTYNQVHEFNSSDEAKKFFLDCMLNSEGAEQSRYVQIYGQLMAGHTYCTDAENITDEALAVIEKHFEEIDRV